MDTAMADGKPPNVDPAIFQHLQEKIDEEGKVREELKEIVQTLEKQGRLTQSILSRIHNTPTTEREPNFPHPRNQADQHHSSLHGPHPSLTRNPVASLNSLDLINSSLQAALLQILVHLVPRPANPPLLHPAPALALHHDAHPPRIRRHSPQSPRQCKPCPSFLTDQVLRILVPCYSLHPTRRPTPSSTLATS